MTSDPAAIRSGPVTDEELAAFCSILDKRVVEHYHTMKFDNLEPPTHYVDPRGKKYRRIVRREARHQGGSVVLFVQVDDHSNGQPAGTIWYPAGWKSPQLNFPRGNIRNGKLEWITPAGGCATAH